MEEQLELFPPDKDVIIKDQLEMFGLPVYVKPRIDALLDGRVSESTLVCCNSGCNICSEIIYECLQAVKKEFAKLG
jgi:hypothetical protein